ncbi:hypothetical protein JOQ06_004948, partial [Pogonophryne albipinna]
RALLRPLLLLPPLPLSWLRAGGSDDQRQQQEIRSERIPSIFTRNFSSFGFLAATFPPDSCGFLTPVFWLSSGQTARCHPGHGSPVRGLLVVIFAQEGHAQPERRRK